MTPTEKQFDDFKKQLSEILARCSKTEHYYEKELSKLKKQNLILSKNLENLNRMFKKAISGIRSWEETKDFVINKVRKIR